MPTSGAVCFQIEGEFLTDLCRSLVVENRWRDGLSMLTESLRGISTDQALSVLRGTHKLTGVNDVDLVEEDRAAEVERYLATVAWQYAGLWFRPGAGSWRPYATVAAMGAADVPRDAAMPDISVGALLGSLGAIRKDCDRWSTLRHLYYADSPRAEYATVEDVGPVLWKKVEDVPLWLEGARESGRRDPRCCGMGRAPEVGRAAGREAGRDDRKGGVRTWTRNCLMS